MLKALENANNDQRSEINTWLEKNDADKVDAMLSLFKATGADVTCRDAVQKYSQAAFDCLEEVAVLNKRKQSLKELAEYLLQREN